jgi:cytochrome c5
MNKLTTIILMLTLSLALASCFDSSSESPAPAPLKPAQPPTSIVGITANGSVYFQNNCAVCHKAGQDDPTSAFGASDLAQRHDMITTDMSNFDATSTFNMMGAFGSVPAQRVADLKAYLQSVPAI